MLADETLLTLAEAAAKLPRRNGRKIHASSVWRWARKGVSGVRLEARRLGGCFFTSVEALDRFSAQLAELPPEAAARKRRTVTKKRRRTEAQRRRDIERSKRALENSGVRRRQGS